MARILILGGGFGGLTTAEKLAAELGSEHQITLVSQFAEFTFYPALVHLSFGNLEPKDIKFDLRAKLTDLGVRFVQGEAIKINPAARSVNVYGEDLNGDIYYDYLVIALGRRLATEKAPGFFEYSHHFLGTKAALKFREAIDSFERGKIVVGLCPDARLPVPICETALALGEKFSAQISRQEISVSVVFPQTLKEAFGGAEIYQAVERELREYNVELIENFAVTEIESDHITGNEETLDYDLLMMLPPFQGQVIVSHLPQSFDEFNYLKVNSRMQIADSQNIYAVGDITAFPGATFASIAIRQAEVAAANILAEIEGKKSSEEYHHDVAKFINEGGANAIYMRFGIWDQGLYRIKGASFPNWARHINERFWNDELFQAEGKE